MDTQSKFNQRMKNRNDRSRRIGINYHVPEEVKKSRRLELIADDRTRRKEMYGN